jgi:hypothetical protein
MTTSTFDDLSKPQQRALIDIVARNGLCRIEAGWDGTCIHRHATIEALWKRGLCHLAVPRVANPTVAAHDLVVEMMAETNAAIRASERR